MFMGQQQRLTREMVAELLQVDLHDDSIHYLANPDVEPPRRSHSPVLPSDEEINFLFLQPFLPGTPRTPDRLIREAYIVHYALRRFVLYRMGNVESLTKVQLLTPKFGTGGSLICGPSLVKKPHPENEGFFKRIRQRNLRSAVCFRSAKGLFALISRDPMVTWPERKGRMDG
jgi:hypothetical protein